MKVLNVKTATSSYPIYLEKGLLNHVAEIVEIKNKILIVSDHGVPESYRSKLMHQFPHGIYLVLPQGEETKSETFLRIILETLTTHHFTRNDCIFALGGGVIGDLAGFASSIYMRGISFYNCPTTLLSQLDSSIGGKTAIDFMGHKNLIGSFYQPKAVFIDPFLLNTLSKRQFSSGLAEAIKCGMIRDEKIIELIEKNNLQEDLLEIIERSLMVKKEIVEHDETEANERKLLNFGHSYGHAIESLQHCLHGEAVAIGMMMAIKDEDLRKRLETILRQQDLPVSSSLSKQELYDEMLSDKKVNQDHITMVRVDQIGHGYLEECCLHKEVFDE